MKRIEYGPGDYEVSARTWHPLDPRNHIEPEDYEYKDDHDYEDDYEDEDDDDYKEEYEESED